MERLIRVSLFPRSIHRQHRFLYAGLAELQAANRLVVDIMTDPTEVTRMSSTLHAVVGHRTERIHLALDCFDGPEIDEAALGKADVYFKRSYKASLHEGLGVRPLGLVFPATTPGSEALERRISGEDRPLARIASAFRRLVWSDTGATRLREIERRADATSSGILFSARCWDPQEVAADDAREISEERAAIVKALRAAFPNNAVAGLEPTPYARRRWPELCLHSSAVRKAAYLSAMHSASICIATRGLRASNGWKLGEYVAAAKCIVAEPPEYVIPGIEEHTHYEAFRSVPELLDVVGALLASSNERTRLSSAVEQFWRAHARPEMLMARVVGEALASRKLDAPPAWV